MTSSSDKLREGIAPLLGPNYRLWAERVKTVLRSHGYWSAVAPGTPPGEGAAAQELKDWTTANAKAYGCIFLTTSDEIQTDLARLGTEDGKVLWDYLRDEYRSTSVEARLQLKSELLDALTAPKESMRDHIGQLAGLYEQLLQIGKPVDEEERCIELLWSLPSAYRGFKWSASATTSWTELRSKILEAERFLNREDEKDAKTRQDAAFAFYHAPSPAKSSGKGGTPSSRYGGASKDGDPFGGACWLCKQKGHRFTDCPHINSAQDFVSTKVDAKKHQDTAAMAREAKPKATDNPADVDFAADNHRDV
ncbi:unnamed protein product [Tilletia controversa]|nr:unnamed protein product [Tilletia controversa]